MPEEKKVLLVTRPLCLPWDEASKNFAYFLAKSVSGPSISVLTHGTIPGLPDSVSQQPIYPSGRFDMGAKIRLFLALFRFRGRFDITHYLFTPTRFNSSVIRTLVRPTRGKTIQTVATLREDLYSEDDPRKMLFADRIVTYTDRSKKRLEEMGLAGVERIYPGIDLELYRPKPKDEDLMKWFGFTERDFIVIYPGEYVRLGATDMLTKGLIDHYRDHPDSKLRFLWACRIKNEADAAKKEEVRRKFAEAGLEHHFFFSDTFADMPKLYNLADVIVFPVGDMKGKFDVPLIIIEAYACGKPVVLSDIPLFGEFSNGSISETVPRGDNEALFFLLNELAHDGKKIAEMGKAARAYAEKEFDLRETAKRYSAVYRDLE